MTSWEERTFFEDGNPFKGISIRSSWLQPKPDIHDWGTTYNKLSMILEKEKDKEMGKAKNLEPTKIIYSYPATIVFWNDGTKTVVKCSDHDYWDNYHGFCAALAKKMFGTNSHLKKMIEKVEVAK